jgi:hypothetical protein
MMPIESAYGINVHHTKNEREPTPTHEGLPVPVLCS